jgi:catechol 2,3-dioxygenase-like lactoylglutathione lyase family enzyme
MITQFAHVCLNVKDLERTVDFYHRKLGLPIKFQFQKNGKVMGAYFQAGDLNFIEAFEVKNLAVTNTGIVHFCLETDNIEEDIRRLTGLGVACTPKKLGADQSWQTWIKDPDGNAIELHEYTGESAQLRGGTVQVTW